MELKLYQYINYLLNKAHYEYDPSVKSWCGWIKGFPGVYAQGKNIEETRAELISALEDYLLLELKEGVKIPGFNFSSRQYAKAN